MTLVEMVLAFTIMSILMTGLASAILIATHALPDGDNVAAVTVIGAEGVDQMVEELREALWFIQRTATSATFTIPDRDDDGVPERLRYAWSGTPGDPLVRRYNGGDLTTVVEGVQEFALRYDLENATETYPGPVVESGEQVLKSYESILSLSEAHVHHDLWWAQYFKPSFANDVLTWKVTRAWYVTKRDHDDDTNTRVQLRLPQNDNRPSDTVIDEVLVPQLSLPDFFSWKEIPFASATGLSPGQGLCLAFITNDANSARLRYRSGGVVLSDAGLIEGNPDWQGIVTDKALMFYIYGTVFTPGAPQTATRTYITGVHVMLRAGDDPTARVVTTAQTLNTPELLSGLWELDFEHDPRLDLNGDGVADWTDVSGTFTLASLSDRVWTDDSKLGSSPNNDFVGLTTVNVRLRCISAGDRAVFRINADWSAGTMAVLTAQVKLDSDGLQALTVNHKIDPVTTVDLVRVTDLPDEFIDLRLVIDPTLNTVCVTVDGLHKGTYPYSTIVPPHDKRRATIYGDGDTAEFEYVSIRVSE